MYFAPESSSCVSAFITKLWQMVNDKQYDDLISWCSGGTSFVIKDQNRFCAELLPKYYKHNNMASFIRQLNKYGFRKIASVESASQRNDKCDLEFAHAHFVKGYPQLLDQIKRKVSRTKEITEYKTDNELVSKLLLEVQQLQTKQNIFESKLATMKNENDALWREHSLLRQKHQKQQQIVNKLIEFLVTLVQQSRSLNLKRRAIPLKLKDGTRLPIEGLAAIKDHSYRSTSPVICEIDPYDIITEEKNSTQQKKKTDIENILVDRSGERPLEVHEADSSHLTIEPDSLNLLVECPTSPGMAVPPQEVSPAIILRPQPQNIPQKKLEGSFSSVKSMLKPSSRKKQQLRSVVSLPVKNIKTAKSNIEQTSGHCIDPEDLLDANEIISLEDTLSPVDCSVTSGINISPGKHKLKSSSSKETAKSGLKSICSDPLQKVIFGEVEDTQNNILEIVNNNQDYSKGESSLLNPRSGNNSSWNLSDITSLPTVLSPSGTDITPPATDNNPSGSTDEKPVSSKDTSLVLSDKSSFFREEMDNHIDLIQSDLDVLKDILNGEGLSLDASTILGLFSSDDPLSLNMPEVGRNVDNPAGNELVSYTGPSLIDIVEGLEEEDLKCPQVVSGDEMPGLSSPQADLDVDLSTPTSSKRFKK